MFSENTFVRIYDCIPLLFPKISGKKIKDSKVNTTIFVIVEVVTVLSLIPTIFKRLNANNNEISNFLKLINFLYYLFSITLNFYLHLRPWSFSPVFLEDMLDFDTSLGTRRATEYDIFLFSTLVIVFMNTFSLLWFIPLMYNLYAVNLLMNLFYTFQAIVIKHLISKRVKLVVEKLAEGKEEDTWNSFLSLRIILNQNNTVNRTYGLRIANGMGNGLATLVSSMCAYWRVFGLHDPYDCYEFRNPYLTPFVHGSAVFEMLFMAKCAKDISGFVQCFSMGVTRKICSDQFSTKYREKMQVIVQELSHISVDITAMDLFKVDSSSFTYACGFVINCMIVFIQFMK